LVGKAKADADAGFGGVREGEGGKQGEAQEKRFHGEGNASGGEGKRERALGGAKKSCDHENAQVRSTARMGEPSAPASFSGRQISS
jgi:hypothetical protein